MRAPYWGLAWAVLLPAQAAMAAQTARVEGYPAKPIRVIVPFPAGGGADLIARVVTQKLTEGWGQQVVVDNRAGAGTIIGAEIAARATPDGYTLIMVNPAHAINPALRNLPFDSIRDFTPVSLIATQAGLLVVHPSLPAHSVREFIALARAKPQALRYASAGVGSVAHLAAELFASITSVKVTHVPYKGTAGYMPDLLSGRVEFMFAPMANVLQQAQSGKLRALAVTSSKRVAALPELPTVMEEGVPGYQAMSWYLLLAPAKTPAAIVGKLAVETTKLLKFPEVQKRMAREGADAAGGTAAEALRFLQDETALWGKVIRSANIKAE
jgi:tripartite-type tricarboxylate transporter receptor subunit TctC